MGQATGLPPAKNTPHLVNQGNYAAALQTQTSRLFIGGFFIAAGVATGGLMNVAGMAAFSAGMNYLGQVGQNVADPTVNGWDALTHVNADALWSSAFEGAAMGGFVKMTNPLLKLGGKVATKLWGANANFAANMIGEVAQGMGIQAVSNLAGGRSWSEGITDPLSIGMDMMMAGGPPTRGLGKMLEDAHLNGIIHNGDDALQGVGKVTLSADDLKARGLTDAQVAEFQQFGHMMGGAGGEGGQLPLMQADSEIRQARNRIAIILGGGINNVDRQTLSLMRQRPNLLELSPELDEITTPAKVAKHMAEIAVQGVNTRWYDKVYVVDIEATHTYNLDDALEALGGKPSNLELISADAGQLNKLAQNGLLSGVELDSQGRLQNVDIFPIAPNPKWVEGDSRDGKQVNSLIQTLDKITGKGSAVFIVSDLPVDKFIREEGKSTFDDYLPKVNDFLWKLAEGAKYNLNTNGNITGLTGRVPPVWLASLQKLVTTIHLER